MNTRQRSNENFEHLVGKMSQYHIPIIIYLLIAADIIGFNAPQ